MKHNQQHKDEWQMDHAKKENINKQKKKHLSSPDLRALKIGKESSNQQNEIQKKQTYAITKNVNRSEITCTYPLFITQISEQTEIL